MTIAFSIAAVAVIAALSAAARMYGSFARERRRTHELQRWLDMYGELHPIGVFHTDAQGRCTYADELSFALAGLRAQSTAGDTWVDAVHPADREHVVSDWMSAAAAGRPYRGEIRVLRPDDSTSWLAAQLRERCDGAGKPRGFVGVVTDVTGRKQTERELERLRGELEARVAERTAALAEINKRLMREVRIHERLERALGRIPSDVVEPQAIVARLPRADQ